jgi:hypothetical protein
MTQRQATKDSKEGRLEKTQRQARKDSKIRQATKD